MISRERVLTALRTAGLHFLVCMGVAGVVAILVFYVWYPFPYGELSGGRGLFLLIVLVDITCGPLLTFFVFDKNKRHAELIFDMSVVCAIQIIALGYGIFSMHEARPIALVFEVDRFRAISAADLEEPLMPNTFPASAFTLSGLPVIGLRGPRSPKEQIENFNLSVHGIEASQRPSWWQDYSLNVPVVVKLARPIEELLVKHPIESGVLRDAIRKTGQDATSLRWLPLVSRKASNWIVLLEASTGKPAGFAPLDGF